MWYVLAIVAVYFIYKFASAVSEDNRDVALNPFDESFHPFLSQVSKRTFQGQCDLTKKADHLYVLTQPGSNHKILFEYVMGCINIVWEFGYPGNMLVTKHSFDNVRNVSYENQIKMANHLVSIVTTNIKDKFSPKAVIQSSNKSTVSASPTTTKDLKKNEFYIIIGVLLKMAQVDGKVDMEELKTIASQKDKFHFSEDELKEALIYFGEKNDELERALSKVDTLPVNLRKDLIIALAEVAVADGVFDDLESQLIFDVSNNLELVSSETVRECLKLTIKAAARKYYSD